MGMLDRFKKQASDAVNKHGDKINKGLDKAAGVVDQRTGGKHTDKINKGVTQAKQRLEKRDGKNDDMR